ncbi:unnamed protein product [Heligmosomoides polygyrus]|uniref:SGF29 C-terminal domain-containing protein n=1 Tax=Heligmosomoides polygyrus TaxID=6339 RepID=A0A183FAS5_HELPZ|nr:unnamed protein product [Heligmosomoides polygyrus]
MFVVADDVVVYFYLRSGDDWVDVRVLSVHYPSKNVGSSVSTSSGGAASIGAKHLSASVSALSTLPDQRHKMAKSPSDESLR